MSWLRLGIGLVPLAMALAVASCRSSGVASPAEPPCAALLAQERGPSRVTGSVFVLQESGGNVVFSMGPDGVLIVDARSVRAVTEVLAFAARRLGGSATLRYIVSTHSHRDHTLGNVARAKDTVVLAQARTAARLRAQGARVSARANAHE